MTLKLKKLHWQMLIHNQDNFSVFSMFCKRKWRWLCEKKNGIPLERRQFLMNLFRKVMYSETEDELNMMILNFKQSSQDFPNFINRFEKFYLISQEWLYVHRKNIIIRGNNTNNYAEASKRILKDIILHRTK
ncbi:uncharacterized protein LOC108914066 [Anoplophora glabripennis]|uniref:uncharacterized protein LOC108914066 n=1 Tax=Anoplophora glabripennis TaxID=217634 RepID=UPI0008751E3A|nr:uncharacterized protein LOC108914066 [Anoplophora glabripennis]